MSDQMQNLSVNCNTAVTSFRFFVYSLSISITTLLIEQKGEQLVCKNVLQSYSTLTKGARNSDMS